MNMTQSTFWKMQKKKSAQFSWEPNICFAMILSSTMGNINSWNPWGDQHIISPYSSSIFSLQLYFSPLLSNHSLGSWEYRKSSLTSEAFIVKKNSLCQYQRKCIEKSMENMDTDIRVKRIYCCLINVTHDSFFYLQQNHVISRVKSSFWWTSAFLLPVSRIMFW